MESVKVSSAIVRYHGNCGPKLNPTFGLFSSLSSESGLFVGPFLGSTFVFMSAVCRVEVVLFKCTSIDMRLRELPVVCMCDCRDEVQVLAVVYIIFYCKDEAEVLTSLYVAVEIKRRC